MPMSKAFQKRLFPRLPALIEEFGTPFHIYDVEGMYETGRRMINAFAATPYRQYYAVKALPDPYVLQFLHQELGFGFDCSSVPELTLARGVGARGEDIMFTSNNTSDEEFEAAASSGGCILNLDDISLVPEVPEPFPNLACFRVNPGKARTGNSIIGEPFDAKYGITLKQVVPAYRAAMERGATRFGVHTMVCSNELRGDYMADTVRMLLEICATLQKKLGIECEFINMGGGFGIPYQPEQNGLNLESMASTITLDLENFELAYGWRPRLLSECGRYVTGPHGVLVSRVINEKRIYKRYLGVDTGMQDLVRPAMYGAYHHIDVLDPHGRPRGGRRALMSVVGSICENCDRLATDRSLPTRAGKGDIIVAHDTGAHGSAMTGNYNGRLRGQALVMLSDGLVVLSRREETERDLFATLNFPSGFKRT